MLINNYLISKLFDSELKEKLTKILEVDYKKYKRFVFRICLYKYEHKNITNVQLNAINRICNG